ncbi:MAG: flagellar assembly protein FliH [Gammaproteobacteria bacterium]|nr:flagellar assembly protein FliH [Gammaproteobacteria bacterium]
MSRILKRDKVTDCRTWQAPTMTGTVAAVAPEDAAQQAMEAARLEGFRQGLEESRAQAAERLQRFDALLSRLASPFEGYEEQLEGEILALVKALTRQLVRREMHADPSQVVGVIREAVKTLPVVATELNVRLHPEDAELIRDTLSMHQGRRPWKIQEDPAIERGGCLVTTANTRVDAELETRLGRLISEMLGSERSDDD